MFSLLGQKLNIFKTLVMFEECNHWIVLLKPSLMEHSKASALDRNPPDFMVFDVSSM